MQRRDIMRSWYLASLVERYHTWPTHQRETVGQHSHGVAMLYERLFPPDLNSADETREHVCAVRWVLEHDLAELWTGDPPFPVKVRYPDLKRAMEKPEMDAEAALKIGRPPLRTVTYRRIKVCDLLQMHLFGHHDVRLGNTYAIPITYDTIPEALKIAEDDGVAVEAIKKFAEEVHHREI